MSYPVGAGVSPGEAALERLGGPFVFGKAQAFLAAQDFASAAHLAERLRASLEDQRECAATQAETAAATAIAVGALEGGSYAASAEHARAVVASLTVSLEAVAHLLASCAFGMASRPLAPAEPSLGPTRSGGSSYVYALLKDHHEHTAENRLFFARACFDLAKHAEAEQALLAHATPVTTPSSLAAAGLPDVQVAGGVQGYLLLGKVCAATGRNMAAASWFRRALEVEPLCWSAWAELCHLGAADEAAASAAFQVDLAEFEASMEEVQAADAPSTPVAASGDEDLDAVNPLLSTPSTRLAAPLRMLSLATPTPRQALFTTPFTHSSTARPAPAPNTASFLTPTQQTAPRAKSGSFVSPPAASAAAPATAAKPRGRHVRASSTSTPMNFGASASSTAAGASTARGRKVASRLQWESSEKPRGTSTSSSSFASGAESSGDDTTHASERERNEKKLGRRVSRSAVLATATPQVKTPRGPDASGPTTPRRATHTPATASAARLSSASTTSAQRVTPAQRRATGAGPPAVAPRKRLPEIAESATPESSAGSTSHSFSAHSPLAGGGTNLLNALQTPLVTPTTTAPAPVAPHSPFVTSRHGRARSQPAFLALQTPLVADDDDESVAPQEDDAIMVHADEEDEDASGLPGNVAAAGEDDAPSQPPAQSLREQAHAAAQYWTTLLQTAADGYRLQHLYSCKEAIATFARLPSHQFHTHFVFASVGRCYFDLQDYAACCRFYGEARTRARAHTLTGMDVYSTALWHMGDAETLSSLALWCMELDALASEAWVVVGNVFSLNKEHELALKFFRRAIQCRGSDKSSKAAYAYTLSAHEYMANEDFERAAVGYRLSLAVDERFYNAWYGLGNLYLRQEKYAMAAYHFKRAIAIHPASSVLHCYLGMTLHEARQHAAALAAFETADRLEPNNPLAKYHMAHVHLALGQEEQALRELRVLQELVPREANVHFLMGKIEKKMGNLDRAMRHFVTALDLDPKDRTQIKAAIDHLHSGSLDDEEDEEI